jgi:hypothetical protein
VHTEHTVKPAVGFALAITKRGGQEVAVRLGGCTVESIEVRGSRCTSFPGTASVTLPSDSHSAWTVDQSFSSRHQVCHGCYFGCGTCRISEWLCLNG